MKKILFLMTLGFSFLTGFSQTFVLSQKNAELEGALGSVFSKTIQITNNSTTDSNFSWVPLNVKLGSTWLTTLCDPNSCYNLPFSNSNNFEISPGATRTFKMDCETETECGSGQIQIAISNKNFSQTDTLTFNIKTWCLGVDNGYKQAIQLLNNPGANEIQLIGAADYKNLQILDISGKTVAQELLNGNDKQQISVIGLPKGVYIIHLQKFGIELNFKFVKF